MHAAFNLAEAIQQMIDEMSSSEDSSPADIKDLAEEKNGMLAEATILRADLSVNADILVHEKKLALQTVQAQLEPADETWCVLYIKFGKGNFILL
jgi:hypothetical protein